MSILHWLISENSQKFKKKKILVFMKQRWTETVAPLRAAGWGWTGFPVSDLGTGNQSRDAAAISALATEKWAISCRYQSTRRSQSSVIASTPYGELGRALWKKECLPSSSHQTAAPPLR